MSEIEILKKSFEANSKYAGWSGQAVVVGLVLDIVFLLAFASDKSWKETAAGIFATLVIGGGVWLELHFGHKGEAAAARLQQISDEKIAQLEVRAAELNLSAEQEKLARVKIEQRLAPRTINVEQEAQIVEELKQFEGTEFTVSVVDDQESLLLLLRVLDVFKKAGWALHRPPVPSEKRTELGFTKAPEIATGVLVRFPPALAEKAGIVFKAFSVSGLYPFRMIEEEDIGDRFHIEVGKKDDGSTLAFLQSRRVAPTRTESDTDIKK